MPYKIVMQYPDGTTEEEDEVFKTREAADDYGMYLVSCCSEGAETLYMSNPGDYPDEDCEDVDFEIVEVDG